MAARKTKIILPFLLISIVSTLLYTIFILLRLPPLIGLVLHVTSTGIWLLFLQTLVVRRINSLAGFFKSSAGREADLSKRMTIGALDEIGDFSKQFNVFMAQLHGIVFELKNIAYMSENIGKNLSKNHADIGYEHLTIQKKIEGLAENSNILQNTFEDTHEATAGIASSIEKVADNINSQSASVDQSSASIEELIA
jgi:methyl-accepting chemotaxis protein